MATSMAFDRVMNLVKRQVDQNSDQNIGSANSSDNNNPSASQLLATLAPVAAVAAVWLAVFIIVRPKAAWKYSPRSQSKLLDERAHTPALGTTRFGWLKEMWKIPDTYVLTHQSLDSYLFLRFLKMAIIICVVGCIITYPVLFPVNATGGGGMSQLNVLSMSNVINTWRFWAHAGCAWLFFGFVLFLITRESIFYINLRQAYLMNPAYTRKLSSRVVLFNAVPPEYLNEEVMREVLGRHVVRIWFPTDTKELDDLVDERDGLAMKLEGAESKLIRNATKAKLKEEKNAQKAQKKAAKKNGEAAPEATNGVHTNGANDSELASRYLNPKDRPTHKLKFLIGKKVDTIDWCRSELKAIMPKVEAEQQKHRTGEAAKCRAIFVEFDTLREAQAAYQSLTHHEMLTMAPRFTGMHPGDVIWKNLRIKGPERFVRHALVTAFVVALIIFWSIPVAVVGVISNITFLTNKLPWLRWILDIPKPILGVVTGLLPSVMLSLLMALLPPVLRLAAVLGGAPTYSAAEYTLQNYYFSFQVVQVFLITTFSSAASSVVTEIINHPETATTLLSTHLPTASNFFISYIILQGLGVFASILVGIAGLVLTPLLAKLLGSTPRKVFNRWNKLATVSWGVVYPVYTNMVVIAMAYACIAPLVLIFAAIGLFFFYFAYRYNFLFVFDTGIDEKGAGYARALQHLFVGCYIAEVCLFGLFATRLNTTGAIGPFILVLLLLIFTAMYQVGLNGALGPLLTYLPKTLEAEEHRALLETRRNTEAASEDAKGDLEADVDGRYPNGNGHADDNILSRRATMLNSSQSPHKKPSLIQKFLKPGTYADYATMRRLVPSMLEDDANEPTDPRIMDDAYLPASVWKETPVILLPRDDLGVSAREVRDTAAYGIRVNDDTAYLDEKGAIKVHDDRFAQEWFGTREMQMRNNPALSSGLLGAKKH